MRVFKLVLVVAIAVPGFAAMSGAAGATGGDDRRTELVRMQDDCDPETFNAVLGEGACVGDGDTTFEELVEEMADEGEAGDWRNNPSDLTIRRGTVLRVVNQGGEAHSFTKVRRFGPGCVAEINAILGFPAGAMVEECRSPAWVRTIRASGDVLRVRNLRRGLHRFECLIHPWMQTTVRVRAHHH